MQPALPEVPTSRRDPALDGLRGLAVLAVFLFHYGGGLKSRFWPVHLLGYATAAGWIGVDLFFVLSGLLITGSLWDSRGEPHVLRNFCVRRVLRIAPLYYTALLLSFFASLVAGRSLFALRTMWIYAVFFNDLPRLTTAAQRTPVLLPLFHLWSVAVEEQFYLLWPFLVLRTRRLRFGSALCLAVFAASCVFRTVVFAHQPLSYSLLENWAYSLPAHAGSLAMGALLALCLRSTWRRIPGLAGAAIIFGLALYAAAAVMDHTLLLTTPPQFLFGLPGVSILSAGLVFASLQPGPWRRFCSLQPLPWIGRISFGFYIFQTLLEPGIDRMAETLTHTSSGSVYLAARLVCALVVSLAAAALSFRYLERPFLALKSHFLLRPPLRRIQAV